MRCPVCGSWRVRRSRSHLKSLWRGLVGAPTRYCPACRQRWSTGRAAGARRKGVVVGLACLAAVGLTLVLGSIGSESVKAWCKSRVVDVYRLVYGEAEHRRKLHEHLGSAYGSVEEEMADYREHRDD
jgi:hypothetical protein